MSKKRHPRFTRRTMLRGMLGGTAVAIGLPVLDLFCDDNGSALADGAAFPRRFGIWYWGNGNLPERWTPRTTGADYELSDQLQPLANVKNDVTVVTGTVAASTAREPHHDGAASFLAGTPINETGQQDILAPTIDTLIRDVIGGTTAFRSLHAGVQPGLGTTVSLSGPGSENPPTVDPLTLYNQVFGEGFTPPGEEPIIDPMWRLRRSALSSVLEEASVLERELGAHDKRRLDEHFTNIRELEMRLLRLEDSPPNLASCSVPPAPLPDYPEVNSRPQMSARSRAVADIMTMALACDRSRVVHTMFSMGVSNVRFPGVSTGHHELSHKVDPVSQDQLTLITQQIVTEYAYFIERLASVPEGDSRLIDNVAILGTSGCSYGAEHEITEYPILIGGSACGAIRTGEHIRVPGELSSKVSLTLMRAMGVNAASFGEREAEVSLGLSELEV